MATESELRYNAAHFLDSYKGCAEGGTLHKKLIDMFNNSGLCTRYKVTYTDAWCAVAVSDCFIGTGLTSIFPCVECGCSNMITLAQKAGIWVENDAYVPSIGDVILYDWQDSGSGDNTGTPDHVGIVQSVSGSSFTVIEGNKSDTVGVRSMTVNGKNIRGFITPKYASAASSGTGGTTGGTSGGTGKEYAEYGPDSSISGTYIVTTDGLNLRKSPGTNGTYITTLPYGTPVQNYGYYSIVDGVKWLYVMTLDGTVGFMSSKYLTKGTSTGTTTPSLPTYTVGSTYTVQVDHLAVRSGAGTSYSKKSKSQLTSNGQANAYSDGCLKKGTKITCQATKTVNGDVWMQIPSGWIAAYYDCEKYVK